MTHDFPPDVFFSLVCENCDAGMEIETPTEALAAGWTELRYAPGLPMANFVGLCPVCRAEEEAVDARCREENE